MNFLYHFLSALVVLLLITNTNAKTQILGSSGGNKLTMTYLVPQPGEDLRVEFKLTLEKVLALGQAAGAICVRTGDASYTPSEGDDMFGINFICAFADGCTQSTYTNIAFYGSTVGPSMNGSVIWQVSVFDMAAHNIGSEFIGSDTELSTRYSLEGDAIDWSNIPKESETSYLKCYAKFDVDQNEVTLNKARTLDSDWNTTETSFIVTASDYTCEEGISCGKTSGSFTMIAPIALLCVLQFLSLF